MVRAPAHGQVYNFEAGSSQLVYSDSAKVRASPALGGGVTDTLLALQAVKIISRKGDMQSGAKAAPWYEISYEKKGRQQRGFVWGGLLALDKVRLGEVQFIDGIEGKFRAIKEPGSNYLPNDTTDVTIGVKAFKNGQPADAVWYNIDRESLNGFSMKALPAKGVPECRSLLLIYFSGEACAIPTYNNYVGWTGTKLITLPQLYDAGDAGNFAHTETYVFPADAGGRPGMLIKMIEETTYDELPSGKEKEKTSKHTERYRWDAGTQAYIAIKK